MKTYNVHFNDENDSNDKGFALQIDEAKDYIATYNGTDNSYFKDYKRGTVSIVCNEDGETVFETKVL